MLADFIQSPRTAKRRDWLSGLRKGLGLTYAAAAEKMNLPRQTILKIEENERHGKITIASLERFAKTIDADFVYGFVPKRHTTYSEFITDLALPHIHVRSLSRQMSPTRRSLVLGSRIKELLSRPFGWSMIWKVKKSRPKNSRWTGQIWSP